MRTKLLLLEFAREGWTHLWITWSIRFRSKSWNTLAGHVIYRMPEIDWRARFWERKKAGNTFTNYVISHFCKPVCFCMFFCSSSDVCFKLHTTRWHFELTLVGKKIRMTLLLIKYFGTKCGIRQTMIDWITIFLQQLTTFTIVFCSPLHSSKRFLGRRLIRWRPRLVALLPLRLIPLWEADTLYFWKCKMRNIFCPRPSMNNSTTRTIFRPRPSGRKKSPLLYHISVLWADGKYSVLGKDVNISSRPCRPRRVNEKVIYGLPALHVLNSEL